MNDRDPGVRLEHRLTKLEQGQVALQEQVRLMDDRIVKRLDIANGRTAAHFDADEQWMSNHDQESARASGYKAGQTAVLTTAVTLASILSAVVVKVVFGG